MKNRIRLLPNERLDIVDIAQLEALNVSDWTDFFRGVISNKPYIVYGFEVEYPENKIGTQATSIGVKTGGAIIVPTSDFIIPYIMDPTNSNTVAIEIASNSSNYIQAKLVETTSAPDTRYFLDEATNEAFPLTIDTMDSVELEFYSTTSGFETGSIPIAIVAFAGYTIDSITDSRNLLTRLSVPYNFRSRTEGGPNPFNEGDKTIKGLKEWMDAVMTRLLELGTGSHWYSEETLSKYDRVFWGTDGDSWAFPAVPLGNNRALAYQAAGTRKFLWTDSLIINNNKVFNIPAGELPVSNDQAIIVDIDKSASGGVLSPSVINMTDISFFSPESNKYRMVLAWVIDDNIFARDYGEVKTLLGHPFSQNGIAIPMGGGGTISGNLRYANSANPVSIACTIANNGTLIAIQWVDYAASSTTYSAKIELYTNEGKTTLTDGITSGVNLSSDDPDQLFYFIDDNIKLQPGDVIVVTITPDDPGVDVGTDRINIDYYNYDLYG